MTNDDLRNMETGLLQMKQMSLRPVLNMMVTYTINFLKPATDALWEAQNAIRKVYLDLDPHNLLSEPRDPGGNLKLLPGKTEAEYAKEIDDLFKHEVEVPLPKFRFRVLDFMESNLSFPPEITQRLGVLVNFEGFEDFVANLQSVPLPTKGATIHRSP